MPKIKNWKKEFEKKNEIMYRNLITGNRLYIYKSEVFDEWKVKYGKIYRRKQGRLVWYGGGKILKLFQYKKNALKFAINWMKKHPEG